MLCTSNASAGLVRMSSEGEGSARLVAVLPSGCRQSASIAQQLAAVLLVPVPDLLALLLEQLLPEVIHDNLS